MSLPTVADLKVHNNSTSSADDGELQDHLDAAIDVVEGLIGPVSPATVTETHRGVYSDVIVLRRMPVASLVSVSSRYGATTTALTLSDYELDADTGIVRVASGAGFFGDFTVSYSVGRSVLPAAIRLAILVIAEHFWKTQRGPAPVGPLSQAEDEFPALGQGYAIPNRARELLSPYMRPVIA